MDDPFVPTAGSTPPELIGRQGLLDEFAYGLRIGSVAPGLLTIFTGSRGIGKTVMLGGAEGLAKEAGWPVISETATKGFKGRIGESIRRWPRNSPGTTTGRRITVVSAAGFSLTTALPPQEQVGWRATGEQLLSLLDEQGTGPIITVDEIPATDRTEISQLAANIQHFIRQGLPIGLVFAGLPSAVSDLLNEGVATFLRRADRIDLHAAAVRNVEASYANLFAEGGRGWLRACTREGPYGRGSNCRLPFSYPTGRLLPVEGSGTGFATHRERCSAGDRAGPKTKHACSHPGRLVDRLRPGHGLLEGNGRRPGSFGRPGHRIPHGGEFVSRRQPPRPAD